MGFKCGIIGLPNVGKSTLFNALTQSNIRVANFPFSTIKSNLGIVTVPDSRLDKLVQIINPLKIIPPKIQFVDIAGLIKGASKGEGLGNQFLCNINKTDVICHVVRCFDDNNIIHVTNKVDPINDINIINNELILSDLCSCESAINFISKKNKYNDKNKKQKLQILYKCLVFLENSNMLRMLQLNKIEMEIINFFNFLTIKPTIYIANINQNNLDDNHYLNKIHLIAKKENTTVIPICVISASNSVKFNQKKNNKIDIPNLELKKIITTGYKLLNLYTFFSVGFKEIHAWTIPVGTTALQASNKIHSDFAKGFIRAQVISFDDFIYYNGEQKAKEAGKIRSESKNYLIQDGDIINFLFNI